MEIRKNVRKNSRKKDGSIGNKKAKRHASPFYVGYGIAGIPVPPAGGLTPCGREGSKV